MLAPPDPVHQMQKAPPPQHGHGQPGMPQPGMPPRFPGMQQQMGRMPPPNQPHYGRPPANMPGMVAPGHPQYQPPNQGPYGQQHGGGVQDAKRKKMVRLWEEELVSQEEKRAGHPRYQQFVQNRISNLQDSIEERLASFA